MSFTPFDPLPASDLNDIVANIESLSDGTGIDNIELGSGKTSLKNDYKFRVYRGATFNSANGGSAVVLFDNKNYDTGSNVDVVTNKGRFTVPVSGFYHFDSRVGSSGANGVATRAFLMLYKNGAEISRGSDLIFANSSFTSPTFSDTVQLAANDYVEIYLFAGSTTSMNGTSPESYFSGHLVSQT